jgi:hypothetical protein
MRWLQGGLCQCGYHQALTVRALQLPGSQPSAQVPVVVIGLHDASLHGTDPKVTPIHSRHMPFLPNLLHALRLQHNLVSAHELYSCGRARRPMFQDARKKKETTKTKQSKTFQSVTEHKLLEALLHGPITIPVTVVGVALAPGTPYFSRSIRDQVTTMPLYRASSMRTGLQPSQQQERQLESRK